MKLRFLVAVAAIAMQPTLALADEGRKSQRVWNPKDPASVLLAGDEVCTGSKQQHTCAILVPLTQEINLQSVSRPEGFNQNIVTNRIVAADETGLFRRGEEAGQFMAVVMDIRSSANAASVWNQGLSQVPAAFTNGMGASALQTFFGPCANGQCQGGGGSSVAYAISNSEAMALVEASLGGCGTGTTCPNTAPSAGKGVTTPPPAHMAPADNENKDH